MHLRLALSAVQLQVDGLTVEARQDLGTLAQLGVHSRRDEEIALALLGPGPRSLNRDVAGPLVADGFEFAPEVVHVEGQKQLVSHVFQEQPQGCDSVRFP